MAQDEQDEQSEGDRKPPGRFTGPGLVVPLIILAVIAAYLYILGSSPRKISYKLFLEQLQAQNVAEVNLFKGYGVGKFKQPVVIESAEKGAATEEPDQAKTESPTEEKKKAGAAKMQPAKPDLRFIVALPERFSESPD